MLRKKQATADEARNKKNRLWPITTVVRTLLLLSIKRI
jgi:hypothetical protein